ncbi:MAG: VOC family protein [Pseudomonadota bacterium]
MTIAGGYIKPEVTKGLLGVHSLDTFVMSVPDLKEASDFYNAFGLNVLERSNCLAFQTDGIDHDWMMLTESQKKSVHHLSFGCYPEDIDPLKRRIEREKIRLLDPPSGFESNGLWFRDPDHQLIEIRVAPKTSLSEKAHGEYVSSVPGERGAPYRKIAGAVRPRRMAHLLMFTHSVQKSIDFYARILGLRLSDRTGDIIAFMHGVHGSDHHMIAFVHSEGPGIHHISWDVPGIQEVGLGAMQMADKGYQKGWGVGRHVLGSNYFHYVRDPWGSYSEYSADMDFVPAGMNWDGKDYEPEDGFYLWGPTPPEDFGTNYEISETP